MKIPAPPVPPDESDAQNGAQVADGAAAPDDSSMLASTASYVYPIDPARPGDDDPDWATFRFPAPPPSWARRKGVSSGRGAPDAVWPPGPSTPPEASEASLDRHNQGPVSTSVLGASFGTSEPSLSSSHGGVVAPRSRPTIQDESDAADDLSMRAPRWAAPVQHVSSWHLDLGRMTLVHPGRRQKIDLSRVGTRARLVGLCGLLHREPTSEDFRSLWLGLDQACQLAFGMSLPELLASSMEVLVWPGDDWE